jgi:hypothetical protein
MTPTQSFARFDIAPINIGKVRGLDAPPSDTMLDTLERQRRQLEELVGIGCQLARTMAPFFNEAKDRQEAGRKITSFDRLTDAIRRLMALEQYVVGIRDTRFKFVRDHWLVARKDAVRQTVDQALDAAKTDPAKFVPAKSDIEQKTRENLLGDLFRGYKDIERYEEGSMRDIVAGICETLGVTTDLSVWDPPAEDPVPEDVILPAGHDWIVPHNGDRPYTVVTRQDGRRVRVHFDSAEMQKTPHDPPKTG